MVNILFLINRDWYKTLCLLLNGDIFVNVRVLTHFQYNKMTVGRQEWPYVLNLANSIMGVSLLAMPFCFMRVSKITVTHTVNQIRFKYVVKVQQYCYQTIQWYLTEEFIESYQACFSLRKHNWPCFAGFELLADFKIPLVNLFYNRCDVYDIHVHVQFYCYIIHVCGLAPELMSMFTAM